MNNETSANVTDDLIGMSDAALKIKRAEGRLKANRASATRKTRTPKMDGVVAVSCALLKKDFNMTCGEILYILEEKFPDRTRKGMYSTVCHVLSIARVSMLLPECE